MLTNTQEKSMVKSMLFIMAYNGSGIAEGGKV